MSARKLRWCRVHESARRDNDDDHDDTVMKLPRMVGPTRPSGLSPSCPTAFPSLTADSAAALRGAHSGPAVSLLGISLCFALRMPTA